MKLLTNVLPNFLLIDLVLLQYESFLCFLNEESLSILALLLNLLFQGVMGLHLCSYLSPKGMSCSLQSEFWLQEGNAGKSFSLLRLSFFFCLVMVSFLLFIGSNCENNTGKKS